MLGLESTVSLLQHVYSLLGTPLHVITTEAFDNAYTLMLLEMQSYCNIQLITSQSILSSFLEQMTPLFSTTATLSCASTTTISRLSIAKSLSNSRCRNLTGPFIVLETESAFLANTPRKWKPYDLANVRFLQQKPLVVCISYIGLVTLPDFEILDDGIEIAKEAKTGRRNYIKASFFLVVVENELESRNHQIGEQNLAFGLKFNAKGVIDCFEKDLQTLPFGQKRDIEFKMVEGDFQLFEGKWSIEQEVRQNPGDSQSDSVVGEEYKTTLLYIVLVKPKVWLPVRLVEVDSARR
ncbi:UNVERIFIED_CONTAM: hypothetical protein Sangu_1596700 [Sesamum angustifolium]|uniref:Coenzyme Q-binding protein COQ10 START domain-containing protein n=1 Tax=Sesamum angustifolium TaxID=2727405 RepID=A0AAW2MUR3_9LAMI